MDQTLYHASWRISRQTTIEPEPQADIVPTGEVRAAISPRSRHRPRRKRAYSGPSVHTRAHRSADRQKSRQARGPRHRVTRPVTPGALCADERRTRANSGENLVSEARIVLDKRYPG